MTLLQGGETGFAAYIIRTVQVTNETATIKFKLN